MDKCNFCEGMPRKFTCPRCNADYCSLKCYQSLQHQSCSEQFYKECVTQELGNQEVSQEGKKKMVDILQRMNDDEDDTIDSDDDEDPLDLAERLQGVNLDDAAETWAILTKEERRQFSELLQSGDVSNILPEWNPWWKYKVKTKKIQEIGEAEDRSYIEKCPEVIQNIPSFGAIKPAACLKYGLLNILYGYAYGVKYFHGDYNDSPLEFVNVIQLISQNLNGKNFENADEALEGAASEVNHHPSLVVSLKFSRDVKKDVQEIVKGPTEKDNFYILSALSDAIEQFKRCVKILKNKKKDKNSHDCKDLPPWFKSDDQDEPKLVIDQVKKHLKKLEFYLSWSNDYFTDLSSVL